MDQYFDEYGTPLKYHKFLKWFSLPLNLLTSLAYLLQTLENISTNWVYGMDMVYYTLSLLAAAITLYGFFKWKPCGFYGILTIYGLGTLYSLVAFVIYAMFLPEYLIKGLTNLLGQGIATVLICVYYLKRRPLFFEDMRRAHMEKIFAQNIPPVSGVTLEDRSGGDTTVCRVCGEKLNAGRTACMKCGTSVRQEPRMTYAYCHRCGTKLRPDSQFCSKCGTQVLK